MTEPKAQEAAVGRSFEFEHDLRTSGRLPLDLLPPETIERLRNGGDLTEEDLEIVRRAALTDSGLAGHALSTFLDSGLLKEGSRESRTTRLPGAAIANEQTFSMTWQPTEQKLEVLDAPQTYYELLTGETDPKRGFFIGARRALDVAAWFVALAIPALLVVVGVAAGESLQTIALMALAGAVVGLMLRYSLPRTPFD